MRGGGPSAQYDHEVAMLYKPQGNSWSWKRYRGLYPGLYTMLALAIFSSPVVLCIRLAADPSISYWVGLFPWVVLAVPGLILIGHGLQRSEPSLMGLIFASIVPSAVLLILAQVMRAPIQSAIPQLQARDCSTFPNKWKIEEAYRAAYDLYQACNDAAPESGLLISSVEDCPEYPQQLPRYAQRWAYLKHLELNEACSGFCFEGETPLWSPGGRQPDMCSTVVGQALQDKGLRNLSRMFSSALVCLILSIIAVVFFAVKFDG
mmetsp:Transcript_63875/g.118747  ORF Transcript_63875/g.118747 Transcript_63875/m.118747 type:complete len:262 (+) Transcript_63875:77-862(+)